ncbi:MAG: cell division protein PerM [Mycobacteriaceae bacterium]
MSSKLSRGRTSHQQVPVEKQRTRDLVTVAFAPSAVGLAVVSLVALAVLFASKSAFTGAFGAVAALWLAIHQVQATIGGVFLGVMPLLPTVVMIWATAWVTSRAVTPATALREARLVLFAALGAPLFVTTVCLAVIQDASTVVNLSPPNALNAFLWVAAIHGLGAMIGLGRHLGRSLGSKYGVPGWAWDAVHAGLSGALALWVGSAVVAVVALCVKWSTVGILVESGGGFGGSLGLTLLSVLYLPNVITGTSAMIVGSSVKIGDASFGLFNVVGGRLPGLPVLGAAPAPPGGGIVIGLIAIALCAAVVVGRQCAQHPTALSVAFQKVAIAATTATTVLVFVSVAAGGNLGKFGYVGVDALTYAAFTLAWMFVIGLAAMLILGGGSGVTQNLADVQGELSGVQAPVSTGEDQGQKNGDTNSEIVDAVAAVDLGENREEDSD